MPLHILIAPDKFKGTLTAQEAAHAIATGWRTARPADSLQLQPISDGGDGFGSLMAEALKANPIECQTVNAAGEPWTATFWMTPEGTAVIESANCIGLALLPEEQRVPFKTDSRGLGYVLQNAATLNAKQIFVGVGGSATNDGGFGMAQALGWQFHDVHQQPLIHWPELGKLASLTPSESNELPPVIVAVDVQNPLLGPEGCSRVYGPQKGLCAEDIPKAETALEQLAKICRNYSAENIAAIPGAGAAGGLGFGLKCFAHADIRPGFNLFMETTGLPSHLKEADVVITGEGAMDEQTMMGKGVGELARLARQNNLPCIALAGSIAGSTILDEHFYHCQELTKLTSPKEAQDAPAFWLEQSAYYAAQRFNETEPS